MNKITIECVWYNSKRDFNKFVRSIDHTGLVIIDYTLIKSKLIKADPYANEPTNSVIGLNIISMLKKCFQGKKKVKTIIYSLKNMDINTIINFKKLIETHTTDYNFILNILDNDQIPNKEILSEFDHVKFIKS